MGTRRLWGVHTFLDEGMVGGTGQAGDGARSTMGTRRL